MNGDHISLYRSGLIRKEWRWTYIAANGNVLADSGEGYARKVDARTIAEQLFPGVLIQETDE